MNKKEDATDMWQIKWIFKAISHEKAITNMVNKIGWPSQEVVYTTK